ncbi:MAG TPA: BlaI/MecI/CopY family transcriptional regulator [Bryobacteraceae bacterium]|nr:BlaI/MecI/CopY family transcriptional regulator [Bryobacteraceae bacterium]HPT24924.1 BlaI/MecI/CopY family transcriptional regulator [Bryobacteraceae bacterium]
MKRGRSARDIPPPLELECLRALWTLGDANVRAVREALSPKRPLAYTTVMTMLDRLARKQAVSRKKIGRSFVYTPLISREDIRQLAVRELLDTLFDGSKETLAAYLTGQTTKYPVIMIEVESETEAGRLDETLL